MYSTMGLATEAKRGLLSLVMPACAKVMSYDMLTGVFGVFAIVALYGIYLVLFSVAIWSTYRESSTISTRMRTLTMVMCFIVTLHTAVEITNFCVWRPPQDATADQLPMKFYVMPVIENLTPCLAGVLSDGFLAWRCYVIWGGRRWLKWLLPTLVIANSALGLVSNVLYGPRFKLVRHDQYHAESTDTNTMQADHHADLGAWLLLGWSWWFFLVNTAMTVSIIGRIAYVARMDQFKGVVTILSTYSAIIRAVIESSLISWIGLLGYNIPYLLPGKLSVTEIASVCSDTLYALLPLIFAISQTLIITRLGLTRFIATVLDQPFSAPSHAMAPTSPTDGETGIIIERRGGREKGHWTTMSVDIDAIHSQLRAL